MSRRHESKYGRWSWGEGGRVPHAFFLLACLLFFFLPFSKNGKGRLGYFPGSHPMTHTQESSHPCHAETFTSKERKQQAYCERGKAGDAPECTSYEACLDN